MLSVDVLSPALQTWSILTGVSAGILLVCAMIFLLIEFMRKATIRWQAGAFLLCFIVSVWSLAVAHTNYQVWATIDRNRPAHGLIAYEHAFASTYSAALARCQFQFIITIVLVVALISFTIWQFLRLSRVHVS